MLWQWLETAKTVDLERTFSQFISIPTVKRDSLCLPFTFFLIYFAVHRRLEDSGSSTQSDDVKSEVITATTEAKYAD